MASSSCRLNFPSLNDIITGGMPLRMASFQERKERDLRDIAPRGRFVVPYLGRVLVREEKRRQIRPNRRVLPLFARNPSGFIALRGDEKSWQNANNVASSLSRSIPTPRHHFMVDLGTDFAILEESFQFLLKISL